MKSLVDLYNQIENQNNSKVEDDNGKEHDALPEGMYECTLNKAEHGNRQDGQDFLVINVKVEKPDNFKNRTEGIFPTLAQKTSTGKPMPEFVLIKSLTEIVQIAQAVGVKPEDTWFMATEGQNYDKIAQALQPAIGHELMMKITLSPNKRKPERPYRNYKFAPVPAKYQKQGQKVKLQASEDFMDNPEEQERRAAARAGKQMKQEQAWRQTAKENNIPQNASQATQPSKGNANVGEFFNVGDTSDMPKTKSEKQALKKIADEKAGKNPAVELAKQATQPKQDTDDDLPF